VAAAGWQKEMSSRKLVAAAIKDRLPGQVELTREEEQSSRHHAASDARPRQGGADQKRKKN